MSIRQIRPEEVNLGGDPPRRDVEVQKEYLLTDGQIEPILLLPGTTTCDTLGPYGNIHAEAIVCAAYELGWESILVTDNPEVNG